MDNIIKYFLLNNLTISTMESCTGGYLSNEITNIERSSEVFNFGAVTYSNDYKIKLGVNENTIKKYTVYSIEVAKEMSKCISKYTNSDIGIGITGKLNKNDINNPYGSNNSVFISIYDSRYNKYYTNKINVIYDKRIDNKKMVIDSVINLLSSIIK